jgi:uncharacterized membrane protein YeaQ/YmgE (transglycosylase-associated protein family)
MHFIIWLLIGGLAGWAGSKILYPEARQGMLMNVVLGIFGAVIGGWLLGAYAGTTTLDQLNFGAGGLLVLLVSLAGAAACLSTVRLIAGRHLS